MSTTNYSINLNAFGTGVNQTITPIWYANGQETQTPILSPGDTITVTCYMAPYNHSMQTYASLSVYVAFNNSSSGDGTFARNKAKSAANYNSTGAIGGYVTEASTSDNICAFFDATFFQSTVHNARGDKALRATSLTMTYQPNAQFNAEFSDPHPEFGFAFGDPHVESTTCKVKV